MYHFTSSDDDLEEVQRVIEVPKVRNFFQETIPRLNNQQLMRHFRISRGLAVQLANRYEVSQYYHFQEGDSEKISAFKAMLAFLWFASNEAVSFRGVSNRFGMTASSLHKIVTRVTNFLSNLSAEIIQWPTNAEKEEINTYFAENDFPGIIGIIGGTHVRIDKPEEDPDSYLNRKHFFSIQAQVVCDHKKKIRDIFVGYPGSVHDSRVFRTSPLFQTLQDKCGEFFIIGDSGYPCLTHCLTPYQDRGNLTRLQRNYNYLLSKNRYKIEHCFGLLKQKFRQLYHLKFRRIDMSVHFIRAMAVLYNLSIEDDINIIDEDHIPIDDDPAPIPNYRDENEYGVRNPINKRNEIANILPLRLVG